MPVAIEIWELAVWAAQLTGTPMFEFVDEQIEKAMSPPLAVLTVVKFPQELIVPMLWIWDLRVPEEAVAETVTSLSVERAVCVDTIVKLEIYRRYLFVA